MKTWQNQRLKKSCCWKRMHANFVAKKNYQSFNHLIQFKEWITESASTFFFLTKEDNGKNAGKENWYHWVWARTNKQSHNTFLIVVYGVLFDWISIAKFGCLNWKWIWACSSGFVWACSWCVRMRGKCVKIKRSLKLSALFHDTFVCACGWCSVFVYVWIGAITGPNGKYWLRID